ncbi:hypothetical protein GF377_02830 [candidate division GN15 bacterium]|nr:hypothetical protein [candidate division GN15 bacterium]
MYALINDYCILRLPTPMVTLGGGQVIDHFANFPRRKHYARMDYLTARISGKIEDLVVSEVRKLILARKAGLLDQAALNGKHIQQSVDDLISDGPLDEHNGLVFDIETMQTACERAKAVIKEILADKSHLGGVNTETLGRALNLDRPTTAALVDYMVYHGMLTKTGDNYNVAGHGLVLKGEVKAAHDDILSQLAAKKFEPPAMNQLAGKGKAYRQAIKFIIDTGKAYKCGSSFLFLPEAWDEIVGFVRGHLNTHEQLAVGDLRDHFGFTRRYAIPVLEEIDRLRITEREGDVRVKGTRFDS